MKLEEICAQITDGKHGDCQDQYASGFYFISCKDVANGQISYKNARQIARADFIDTHRRTKLEPLDIVITNSGTIGRMALVRDDERTRRTTFQKSVAIIKPLRSRVEPAFLYYSLLSDTRRLTEFAGGTAQKNLLLRDLRGFLVDLPPLVLQRRIAGILAAYDDLIENNLRRIQILEQMARALYREWFVDFRFPSDIPVMLVDSVLGMVPSAWTIGRLDDLIVLQRGFDLPTARRVSGAVPIYAATGVVGFHDSAKVTAPGVVTGRSGTIGEVAYVQQEFWPLNTALWVKEFRNAEPLFAFFHLAAMNLRQFSSGAAVPTLNRNHIHGSPTLIPARALQKQFQDIAGPMFEQIDNLTKTNENLHRTRDLLLPRLLSGQISLDEAAA